MRVTNKMIMNNAASNINLAKEFVNTRNKQMTSQKKIDKPSDDPVIAVRSLRLSTTLSQVTQYYDKNIPDASQWLQVTETALINMRDIGKDCREIAVGGSTDSVNSQDDRKTMLTQLQSLQKQLYAEGNADYAQRTVFTGFRTNRSLTFTEDETDTIYRIDQSMSVDSFMEEHRYYSGNVEIPTTEEELLAPSQDPDVAGSGYKKISDIYETDYYRLRLGYGELDTVNKINIPGILENYEFSKNATTDKYEDNAIITSVVGTDTYYFMAFDNETAWANSTDENIKGKNDELPEYMTDKTVEGLKSVASNAIILNKETGELIFGEKVAAILKQNKATVDIQYDKVGFDDGELRPEYYYNCSKMFMSEETGKIEYDETYTKFDDQGNRIHFDIEYTIAANQTININTEASDVFDSSIQRDLGEMIDAVQHVINAYDKLDTLDTMKRETQYASDEDQEWLQTWIDAAQKEFDFYNNNMRKLFDTEIGKIDKYYAKISLAITDLGCKKDSLDLTKVRVGDQQETVQDLQSHNDDIDLSQIIIDYTAAYTAYQASLTAAGKLGDSTLLNYI